MRLRTSIVVALVCWLFGTAPSSHADPPVSDELAELDARLVAAPSDLGTRLRRADTLLRMGRASDALDDVREAELLAPTDGRTPLLRAGCLVALGRLDEARATLDETAIERAPRAGEALALRARIEIALGDDDAARLDLDRAILSLAETDLFLLRAEVERRLGVDDVPGLTEGLLRTGSVVLEAAVARSLERTGRLGEALELVRTSALPAIRRDLAASRLLLSMGRTEEARAATERTIASLRPLIARRPSAARHLELALALALGGLCGEAATHYDAAARLSPAYAASEHPGLGSVSAAVSDCGRAR